jgi:hypothetical protein
VDQEADCLFLLGPCLEGERQRFACVSCGRRPVPRAQLELGEPEEDADVLGLVAGRVGALELGQDERPRLVEAIDEERDQAELIARPQEGREGVELALERECTFHVVSVVADPEHGLRVAELAQRDSELKLVAVLRGELRGSADMTC